MNAGMPPMPPAGPDPMGGAGGQMPDDGMAGGEDPMGGAGGQDMPDSFEPGIQADKETDPKKYIQGLAGELAQEVRKFNDENGQPDKELNKFVAGMILAQATKGLDEKDRNEVIRKLNTDNPEPEEGSDEDGEEDVPDDGMEDAGMQMESTFRKNMKPVYEVFGISDEQPDSSGKRQKLDKKNAPEKGNPKAKPFMPRRFR